MDFPGGSDDKEYAFNAGDLGWIPGSGRFPGEENGYPLKYFGLKNSTDCIVPWGHKESDTTKGLTHTHTHTHTHTRCTTQFKELVITYKYLVIFLLFREIQKDL